MLGALKKPTLASEKGWFYEGKTKDLSGGTIPGPGGSPTGSRGGFRRSQKLSGGPPEASPGPGRKPARTQNRPSG